MPEELPDSVSHSNNESLKVSANDQMSPKKRLIVALSVLVLFLISGGIYFKYGNVKLGNNAQKPISTPSPTPFDAIGAEFKHPNLKIKGLFFCPTVSTFCTKTGEPFQYGDNFVSFGGNLPVGTSLYASFDGELSGTQYTLSPVAGSITYSTLFLINKSKGLRAEYYFIGDPPKAAITVKQGDKIGIVKGKIADITKGKSFIFRIYKGDSPLNQVDVTLADFVTK